MRVRVKISPVCGTELGGASGIVSAMIAGHTVTTPVPSSDENGNRVTAHLPVLAW